MESTIAELGFINAVRQSVRLRTTLLAGAFFFLLFARRSDQLLYPQVWDEDGRLITDIVLSGPLSIFHSINGYLTLVPKLIDFVAMLFPLPAFAFISTVLAWVFVVGVLLAVSLSPTTLKGGPLLALVAMLIPSDAEVYGIPLYTFWWAPLLLVTALFWKPASQGLGLRVAFAILGGLSSPMVVIVAPLAALFALRDRRRSDIIFALVCVACALVQGTLVVFSVYNSGPAGFAVLPAAFAALPKFVGMYAIGNIWVHGSDIRPLALLLFTAIPFGLVVLTLVCEQRNRLVVAALAFLWLGSILLSCGRVNPAMFDPIVGGPRYFFYPFLFEGWLLVQIALTVTDAGLRRTAAALLLLAAFNTLPILNRTHEDLDWKGHVAACAATPGDAPYVIPIQYAGSAAQTFSLTLSGSDCRALSRFGLLGLAFQHGGS